MLFTWKSRILVRIATSRTSFIMGLGVAAAAMQVVLITRLWVSTPRETPCMALALAVFATAVIVHELARRYLRRQGHVDAKLLEAFFEHSPDRVYIKDAGSHFVRMTSSMARACGLVSPASAVGKTDADIFSEEHAAQALADEWEIIHTGRPMLAKEEKETWPDGHETWVITTKLPLMSRKGKVIGIMGISHDITERKLAEFSAEHAELHDSLTGLPNRRLFQDWLTRAIGTARYRGQTISVLVIDIDRFKYVNEALGHQFGDRMLAATAARLKAATRPGDIIGRLCGDQFALAVTDVPNNEALERMARHLLSATAEPIVVDGNEIHLTASMGIAQFPGDSGDTDELLRYSDLAMYDAKRKGRGKFSFFSPVMTDAAKKQQMLESDLLGACARDEFTVHYQPIVDSKTGNIAAMEALLRWRHPTLGVIHPDQFIPLLEDVGLMAETGRWVLRTACRQAAEWEGAGFPGIRVAVNVSNRQIYEGNIAEVVRSALRESGLTPSRLELELTESHTLDGSEATISILRHLKEIGVSLSLDDFGTGWSSLSYLRQFPLDRIKIDRGFVRDLGSQPRAEKMLRSILSMARSLGLSTVVEGVETSLQRDLLRRLSCNEMQGFFFSRPLPATDATALLHSFKWGTVFGFADRNAAAEGFRTLRVAKHGEQDPDEAQFAVQ